MPNRVIAVTGGKGGVGKSTTTVNLGVSLRMDGYSVALVDADVEMPNLVELLDLEPEQTLHDVLGGTAEPHEALVEIGQGFAAIPGDNSLARYGAIEPERLQQAVDALAWDYDVVLLDTGAGLSYDDLIPIGLADEILLVSSPDPATIENAKRTQAFVSRLNRQVEGVVITKADEAVDGSVAESLDTELLGVIPEDPAVRKSTAAGEPLEVYAPTSPAAQAYRQLEANVTDGVLPPQRSAPEPEPEPAQEPDEPPADDGPESAPIEEESGVDLDEDDRQRGLLGRLVRLVT